MTPPKHEPLFAILTVRLDAGAKPASDRDAYETLKSKLGLGRADVDDVYGAMPVSKVMPWMSGQLPENSYLILISREATLRLMEEKHENVVGWHHAALVPSGKGPQPLTPGQTAQIMKYRSPKGPQL
jgi:hypothetical protein